MQYGARPTAGDLSANALQMARAASAGPAVPAPSSRLWLAGFVTSAANPEAIVFFAALFPQFVDPSRPVAVQFLMLGATYLAIDAVLLAGAGPIATAVVIGLRSTRAGAQGSI